MKKLFVLLLSALLFACTESEDPSRHPIEGDWQPEYVYWSYFNENGDLIELYKPQIDVRYGVWKFKKSNYVVETKTDVFPPIPYRVQNDSVLIIDHHVVPINQDGTLTQEILVGPMVDGSFGPVYFEAGPDSLNVYNRILIDEITLGGKVYSDVVGTTGAKYSRIK